MGLVYVMFISERVKRHLRSLTTMSLASGALASKMSLKPMHAILMQDNQYAPRWLFTNDLIHLIP